MAPEIRNLRFPLWQFLNQPLFSTNKQLILNPRRFSYFYRLEHLERCLNREFSPKR